MRLTTTPICLDVSRTLSRAGAGAPSGVDRVERAYIRWALEAEKAIFLARVFNGILLLDADGMRQFLALSDTPNGLDRPDTLSLLARRQSRGRRRAESTARRLARAASAWGRLPSVLAKELPSGFTYLSVGHSNQRTRLFEAVRAGGARRIICLLHDVIPLDYPEYTRPGAVERFAEQFRAMAEASDLMLCNSAHTQERARHWLSEMDVQVDTATALLGTDRLEADEVPMLGPKPGSPSFLCLGTIEPRKNHLLLLAIWRRFHETLPPEKIPHLHIVGRRGWENENILAILDRAPFMGRSVFEQGFLSDEDLAALMAQAHGLLFPSFAEGFGYPLVEALQAGKSVIASPLPPFGEIAGKGPRYIDPLDGSAWAKAILDLAAAPQPPENACPDDLPDWDSHFLALEHALQAQERNA